MKVQDKRLTADEFEALYMDEPYELIEGKLIEVSPTAASRGSITSRVTTQLRLFVDAHRLGEVYGAETGFMLSPITVRAPDAAFIGNAKLALIKDADRFLPFAPDLAVAVVSPNDRATQIQKKIELFLTAGTPLIWIVYADMPRVIVYRPDQAPKTVLYGDVLDGDDVLPGLHIAVADLFPPPVTEP